MKKFLAIILFGFVAQSFGISSFSYFWTIRLTGDTATVTKWKANNDSVLAFATRATDTLNKGIPRWKAFSNHDSTFKWMNIDTIPSADTIYGKNGKFDKLDSIFTTAINAARHYGTTGTFTGMVKGDSLYVRIAKQDSASIGILRVSTVGAIDSVKSRKALIDTVVADSVKTRTILSTTVTATTATAVTGHFDTLASDTIRCRRIFDSSLTYGNFILSYPATQFGSIKYDTVYWKKWTWPDTMIELIFNDCSGTNGGTDSLHMTSDSTLATALRPTDTILQPISIYNFTPGWFGSVKITPAGAISFGVGKVSADFLVAFDHFYVTTMTSKGHYPFTVRYRQ
jgi:hypothetical protein